MSRVVIYGEYPPLPGAAAEATLEAVRARLGAGAEVEVVSPRPSAAHHHADLGTVRGAAFLARLASGADLELTLDPALLAARGGRGAPAQAVLALAVNNARHSTVSLGPLGGPTGRGRVRLVLGRADAVVAASQSDADALERAGVDRSRLSVRTPGEVSRSDRPPDGAGRSSGSGRTPWGISDDPSREELEAAVRRRAAEDRESAAGTGAASTWPLDLLGPFSPPSSGKPRSAVVNKVVDSLIAWVVLPMAEHVNHLQRATIESLERHSARPDHTPSDHTGDRPTTIS